MSRLLPFCTGILVGATALVSGAFAADLAITTDTIPAATHQKPYEATVQMSSGSQENAIWSVASGQLPEGVSLSANGKISGTPAKIGVYDFTVKVSQDGSSASRALSLVVDSPLAYPSGTLLKLPNDPTVYWLEKGFLRSFRTPTEFLSHGLQWDWLVTITQAEFDIYPMGEPMEIQSGTLVLAPGAPTVYLIQGGDKHYFDRAEVFLGLGYSWDAILTMQPGETEHYNAGELMRTSTSHFPYTKVKTANNPTVYLLVEGGDGLERRAIPSPGVFLSHGWRWPEIITLSQSTLSQYPAAETLFYRDGTLLKGESAPDVYVMEYEKRRLIPTGDDFEGFRYRWDSIVVAPQSEVSAITMGSPVKADSIKREELASRRKAAQKQPHSAEYLTGTVNVGGSEFSYKMVKATLSGTAVKTLSAAKNDCSDNCPTQSLSDYVGSVGGFAGIHGTYFCPPDYNWCGGQVNRYDSPLFDSQENRWLHWGKRSWNHRGALTFSSGHANSYWPGEGAPESGIEAGIMNYPMLTYQGNVVASEGNTDSGQRNRGSRAGIGVGGGYIYLVQVNNATVIELAWVMQSLGAGDALNLDGGGTTALYYEGSYRVGPGRALPNAIVLVRE